MHAEGMVIGWVRLVAMEGVECLVERRFAWYLVQDNETMGGMSSSLF